MRTTQILPKCSMSDTLGVGQAMGSAQQAAWGMGGHHTDPATDLRLLHDTFRGRSELSGAVFRNPRQAR